MNNCPETDSAVFQVCLIVLYLYGGGFEVDTFMTDLTICYIDNFCLKPVKTLLFTHRAIKYYLIKRSSIFQLRLSTLN